MQHRTLEHSSDPSKSSTEDGLNPDARNLGLAHPVLSRLVEEVRNEGRTEANYDRVHNRHNRGK